MHQSELDALIEARQAGSSGEGRRIREAARLSQDEVGQFVGVTGATVSRWESGARLPHGQAAIRWARLLARLRKQTEPIEATP